MADDHIHMVAICAMYVDAFAAVHGYRPDVSFISGRFEVTIRDGKCETLEPHELQIATDQLNRNRP